MINPDPDFPPTEKLYHRFNESVLDERIFPASIRFPVFCVNREKYSKCPEDVINYRRQFKTWGIICFAVMDILQEFRVSDPKNPILYEFKPFHVPEVDNEAHTEIRTLKNGRYRVSAKISNKELKMKFRTHLADRAIILKKPAI
ncbi:hypothetical protein JXA32_03475 [Candidatus Sumerlaeota bacterium]|nr:hypothetical protein [Candidatus Sumerlaeota bacterium]